ncbi:hypothetical protein CYMTET_46251 [Cymbomonas tetramitiformis]|uniref:Uncharacterized protein n=1 Tax=Cymbomonas tetramitiformis TaxID=36881 RepID=A0AAE0BWI1_9CHLO|nr:hypothetical protein CYMTET_46251 [Cymbomonas tetramitiformis]
MRGALFRPGTWEDVGGGRCKSKSPLLFDGLLGDRDKCKAKCLALGDCAYIVHGWGCGSSMRCTLISRLETQCGDSMNLEDSSSPKLHTFQYTGRSLPDCPEHYKEIDTDFNIVFPKYSYEEARTRRQGVDAGAIRQTAW